MKRLIAIGLSLLFAGTLCQKAQAGGASLVEVAGVGTVNFSTPRLSDANGLPPTAISPKMGLGVGALVYFPFFPGFNLETGVLYVSHRSNITLVGSTPGQLGLTSLMVPVMIRFTALPVVSFGAGIYGAKGIGKVSSYDPATGNLITELTYAEANTSDFDLGAIVGASLNISLLPMTSILIDLNYYLGLKNLDTTNNPNQTIRLGGILGMVGVKFGF